MEIQELEPKKVFDYFQRICSIPHGSGNTKAISQYCMDFAKERGLKYHQDAIGNVVIFKNASVGYESSEPIILQGHLDMVCDKSADCDKDMEKDGLDLCTDGEYVWANGTSLGADDGIAVAYILALLDSDDVSHPPIEALLTVDEEIGMLGVNALDASVLKGKRLINIDTEKEGVLMISCAGGVRAKCTVPISFVQTENDECVSVRIEKLRGGHSGIDIAKHRTNAIKLLGRLLEYVNRRCSISVVDVSGGGKENAIPKNASAKILCKSNGTDDVITAISDFCAIAKKELHTNEPNLNIVAEKCDCSGLCMDEASTKKIIFALMQVPDGIQAMSPDVPDMVQTSVNLGTAYVENNCLIMKYLLRSNAAAGKQRCVEKLVSFVDYLDGRTEFTSDYPAWEYRLNSPLRNTMIRTFREVYAYEPEVQAIHAGLECGLIASKIPDIDMISFGPDLENVHTFNERMSVASAERCWNYLLKALENLK